VRADSGGLKIVPTGRSRSRAAIGATTNAVTTKQTQNPGMIRRKRCHAKRGSVRRLVAAGHKESTDDEEAVHPERGQREAARRGGLPPEADHDAVGGRDEDRQPEA